jgi:hypothetical protein
LAVEKVDLMAEKKEVVMVAKSVVLKASLSVGLKVAEKVD